MKVLSIGTDRKIFEEGSSVRQRVIDYSSLFNEYYIIVYSLKSHNLPKIKQINHNTWAIPTNSNSRLDYIKDAIEIGKQMAGIDWITTQDPFETGWAGMKLKSELGVKFNVQIHTDFINRHFRFHGILNFIRTFMAGIVLKKADSVRVVSQRIKNSLVKKYKLMVPINVLPIFVEAKKVQSAHPAFDLHKKYPAFKKIILTATRIEPEKDLDFSLEIFQKLLKKHKRLGYVIVGDGSERNRLEAKAKALRIDKNVVFAGWQDDLISYLKTADIYLSTSRYEGYGLSLIEASISGTPVVTTDVGVAGDILMNKINSMICPVGDERCFLESIERLIDDKDFYNLIKKNAENIAKKIASGSKAKYLQDYKKSILGK